jgi:hypothetical protein
VATVKSLTSPQPDDFFVSVPQPGGSWSKLQEYDWESGDATDEVKDERCRIDRDLVRVTIRSILQEVVSKKRWADGKTLNDVFFPPTRANYDFSVAKGGGVTGFCQDSDVDLDDEKCDGGLLPVICEKESGDYVGHFMFRFDKSDTARQDYVWSDILSRIRACDSVQVLKPIGLAEPLKVRVITKGSWKVFMALRNLQQFLAKELKRHPAFVLTGTPVTQGIISSLGRLGDGEGFLNGDYTAATNNIRSWISRIYVEELCEHLNISAQLSWLLMDGMVNNIIEDPEGGQHTQMSGQPMGFNNSFVGLCVCNAALAKIVRAWDMGAPDIAPLISLRESRILVNGDDLVMPVSAAAYEVWKVIGSWVGLSPSIGKTYFTPEFAQINSRNFTYDDGVYTEVHSINMGLLEGAAKKGRHVNEMTLPCALSQLANNYRQLMNDCNGDMDRKLYIHNIFVRLHKEKLEKASVPWYVPCWAGGLGLTGYFLPNEYDRRGMHEVRMNYEKYQPKSIPVQEDAVSGEPDKMWYVHQLAADRLPKSHVTFDENHPGIEPYQLACGRMAVDMLFDAELKIDELFRSDSVSDRAWKNLRHNRRIWRVIGRKPALPDPLWPVECVERTQYECFPMKIYMPYSDDVVVVKDLRMDPVEGCPEGYVLRVEHGA